MIIPGGAFNVGGSFTGKIVINTIAEALATPSETMYEN
jgi:hypothetical protein